MSHLSGIIVQPHLPVWDGLDWSDFVLFHRYRQTREGYAWHAALIRQAVIILRAQWIVLGTRPRLGQFCLATTVAGVTR